MISRKLAFPSGAQKSVLRGTFGVKPRTRFADEKAGFYDRDARNYFARAGVKSGLAKDQISRFVKGIKKLGLWNNMVCWPLRSSQNAGTGTTAYSMGGLQSSNATMSGGSWLSDGFSLSSTQQGSSTLSALTQNVTLLICARGDGTAYGSFPHVFGVQSASTWSANEIRIGVDGFGSQMATIVRNSSNSFVSTTLGSNPLNSSTSFTFLSGTLSLGSTLNYRILTTNTTVTGTAPSSGTSTLNRMQLNGRWDGALALANPMVVSFCAIITPNISGSESSIYSLYKSTLGQGLGLP